MKLHSVKIKRDLRAFAIGVLVGEWRQVLPTMTTYSRTVYICIVPGFPIAVTVFRTSR